MLSTVAARNIFISKLVKRAAYSTIMSSAGPVEAVIQQKLSENLKPSHLEVVNESSMHNVPKGSETHFKVIVISETFHGLPIIKRHRLVNKILATELQSGVHALSIVAKTGSQWEESEKVEPSPKCRGGSGL